MNGEPTLYQIDQQRTCPEDMLILNAYIRVGALVPVERCKLDDTLRAVPGLDKLTAVEYLHLHQAVTAWGAGIGGDGPALLKVGMDAAMQGGNGEHCTCNTDDSNVATGVGAYGEHQVGCRAGIGDNNA